MIGGDIWAVSPSAASAAYFRVAATHGAGALTLLQSNFTAAGAINGCGYRLTLTSVGDLTGVTYTIVGTIVGAQDGVTTTEAIAGGSTATVTTTNYWSSITSITASGTSSANTLSVGYAVNLALPRTRIRGWSYVGAGSAGSIVVTINSTTGTNILTVDTPASTAASDSLQLPGNGIVVGRSAPTDFGIVVLTQITKATLYCG